MILIGFSSCSTKKYLSDGQYILTNNYIDLKANKDVRNKSLLKYELNSLIKQTPNTSFLGIPREWIYLKNADPGDSSWFNNWARNSLGQPPQIYDEFVTEVTAENMQNYLRNTKGFYDALVTYNTEYYETDAEVHYLVDPKERHHIKSIEYFSRDKAVLEIIENIKDESLLKPGDPLDKVLFDLEKNRIANTLQNQGYANFIPNYIELKGDSSNTTKEWEVFFVIQPPAGDSSHQIYRVGEINVYTDYYKGQDTSSLQQHFYQDIDYHSEASKFIVRPTVINRSIFLNEGDLMRRNLRVKTYDKLSNLGAYRFVSMEPFTDAENDSIINYNIFLQPFTKNWIADFGSDIFYSTISQAGRDLFGFSVNTDLQNRNLFGGSERFTISAETGLELQVSPFRTRAASFSLQNTLEIPKQVDYFGLAKGLRALGIFNQDRYNAFKEDTYTNINIGYNQLNVLDFYSIASFSASLGYTNQPDNKRRIDINQIGLNLNRYILQDSFIRTIDDNLLIINSFQDNLFTGFLFRDITYLYTGTPNRSGRSYTFIGTFEASGWETHILNNILSNEEWILNNEFTFAKYFRLELDGRYYKRITQTTNFATRVNLGIITPFGGQESTPFVKQFSVGGPNSLRAWDQKELGPGSFFEQRPDDQPFYQQGDIKIEFNAEFRFDLFWIVEGALFTDIGNVWTLKEDAQRPGANFTSSFYDDLAIAGGWGIRWDLIYFNIRFDFGYKIRDPFWNSERGSHWYNWNQIRDQGFGNWQIAVNYPF